jgi:hypothetical protein
VTSRQVRLSHCDIQQEINKYIISLVARKWDCYLDEVIEPVQMRSVRLQVKVWRSFVRKCEECSGWMQHSYVDVMFACTNLNIFVVSSLMYSVHNIFNWYVNDICNITMQLPLPHLFILGKVQCQFYSWALIPSEVIVSDISDVSVLHDASFFGVEGNEYCVCIYIQYLSDLYLRRNWRQLVPSKNKQCRPKFPYFLAHAIID